MIRDRELRTLRHELMIVPGVAPEIWAVAASGLALAGVLTVPFGRAALAWGGGLVGLLIVVAALRALNVPPDRHDRAWRRLMELDGGGAVRVYGELMATAYRDGMTNAERPVPPEVAEAELLFLDRNLPLHQKRLNDIAAPAVAYRREFLVRSRMAPGGRSGVSPPRTIRGR